MPSHDKRFKGNIIPTQQVLRLRLDVGKLLISVLLFRQDVNFEDPASAKSFQPTSKQRICYDICKLLKLRHWQAVNVTTLTIAIDKS